MMNRSVLLIDSIGLISELLGKMINGIEGFEVCGTVADAYGAASAVGAVKPSLIILCSELPGGGRVKFLRRLIPQYTVPVIAVSEDSSLSAQLLAAGAADIIGKPVGRDLAGYKTNLTASMKNALNLRSVICGGVEYRIKRAVPAKGADRRLILIGGSTGSTEALPVILAGLGYGSDDPLPPLAAVLHMPVGYTAMYAGRISKELGIRASEAEDGEELTKERVVIAQGARHLRIASSVTGFVTRVTEGERISGHCPSVDALFSSAAELDAGRIVAVLLTGMGSDGARGLLRLREAGAYTIGQDEKSSVVYGMPKAAFDIGAVAKQCPLEGIAREIRKKLKEWE